MNEIIITILGVLGVMVVHFSDEEGGEVMEWILGVTIVIISLFGLWLGEIL